MNRGLYGCINSALLFWEKLSKDLKSQGFELNPYDPCVANKMINGKQFTIVWHVDDLKMSHKDPKEVTKMIKWIESKYGEIRAKRGKLHNYLGMVLDYQEKGTVKIIMETYINKMMEEHDITGTANTPAANHLFKVNPAATKLVPKKAAEFHTITAKCLFLCKRARPDISTAVAFLTTRVQQPDEEDEKKLHRLLHYLNATRGLHLRLSARNGCLVVKWWADGAFAVHPDMKSHSGVVMSLGMGAIYNSSRKQKLNTTSSTESELVAASDSMPQILWTMYFLRCQGYKNLSTILFQDNQSAILLEKNGILSSSRCTRHINIKYFFIQDKDNAGDLSVQYCPADKMIADFHSKPLQGKNVKHFCDQLMGHINFDS